MLSRSFCAFILGFIIAVIVTSLATSRRDDQPLTNGKTLSDDDLFDLDPAAWVRHQTEKTVTDVHSGARSRADLKASNIAISRSLYANN